MIRIQTKTRESGDLKFDPECDLCDKTNYPMAGWDCKDDLAEVWICLDCMEAAVFDMHHYEEEEEENV